MAAASPRRVLGAQLADGITKGNMWALLTLATAGTAVISFLPSAQPHVLTTVLGVPESSQGTTVGLLGFAAELAMVLSLAWYGALADRFGRRLVVVAGLLLCAAGAALFPFAANTTVLVALRVVFGLGVAALNAMLSTIAVDYVRTRSRGKSYGLIGVFGGLGAVLAVLALVRLPRALESAGLAPVAATRLAFLLIAAGVLATAGLLWLTLSPVGVSEAAARVPLARLVREGVALARDPGVALSYAASFVARADLAIVVGFMTLWIADHATDARGMSSAEALARAGAVVGVSQTVALLCAPLFGWLGDRVRRQDLVVLAQALAAAAYLSTLLVDDPLGGGMMAVAVLVGVGEIAVITTAGPLLAQQAPAEVRGSAFGVHTLCGAAGIMIISALGGWLYDTWRPAGPFVVAGVAGLLVTAFGLAVRRTVRPRGEADPAREAMPTA
ncbi:MFS transporter [Sphaerisporangium krabiense]|uniref:MFS family permease n=1 Tax=Sphaerisporangium krabiense TaxID=763782 RepID=A0A7W8Z9H8_9ACTN|nr:MFS transporter [Sphaerisporangium krabiense]MBB5629899.1 MFS family permease [Sphaerisporangium krabiense]GII64001.1 MFS transporter [Sphaerisporangium krabiense]